MAKDPAVLLWTKDFLVGTMTMSYEQKRKYITLLCLQHQNQSLTDGDMKSILNEEDIQVAEKFIKEDWGTDITGKETFRKEGDYYIVNDGIKDYKYIADGDSFKYIEE